MIDWADALSRLHPVLLHLPIGLFVALAWLQVWWRFKARKQDPRPMRAALVLLLVVSTPCAAASGWLLHEGESYPEPVNYHEWCGIALAFVALAIGCAHVWRPAWYSRLLWLGVLLLLPTAHFGGTLTHGEGFLTDPWIEPLPQVDVSEVPRPLSPVVQPEPEAMALPIEVQAPVFADVLPIFEELCTRCHGQRKQRADLALHSVQAIMRGGESGAVVVPGHPEESYLMGNLRLPLEHDFHMPPARKSQPTLQQIQLVEAWIAGFAGEPE